MPVAWSRAPARSCPSEQATGPMCRLDAEWAVVEPLLPVHDPRAGGRPLEDNRLLVVDPILYVLVSGCAWWLLPHDLVTGDAAYRWFRASAADRIWDLVHDTLATTNTPSSTATPSSSHRS